MPKPFRLMKAATLETEQDYSRIRYPIYGSPKYDGIRIGCHQELGPVTNQLKGIPNRFIRSVMSHPKLWGFDGEIIVGDPTNPTGYSDTQSAFSSHEGEPAFKFYIFDDFTMASMQCRFPLRLTDVLTRFDGLKGSNEFGCLELVEHTQIHNREELDEYTATCVASGYEGSCFRGHDGVYKFGRSTMIDGHLIKHKPFVDAEARIDGFDPLMRNRNEPKIDGRGLQVRGYSKDGKVEDPTMVGAVNATVLNGPYKGCEIRVGSGLDDAIRADMKAHPERWIGKVFTFKYQKFGSKDLPRSPIWKGLRHDT